MDPEEANNRHAAPTWCLSLSFGYLSNGKRKLDRLFDVHREGLSVDYFSFISYTLILFISTIIQTFKNLLLLPSLFLHELTQITLLEQIMFSKMFLS